MRCDVCALDELSPGRPAGFLVNGHKVLLVVLDDGVHAVANRCTHQYQPLESGFIEARNLRCRFHGVTFSIDTGALVYAAGYLGLDGIPVYPVSICDGRVQVDIPE